MEQTDVKLVIASNYYPQKTPSLIAEKTGAAFLSIPTQVEGQDGINTYIDLFDAIVGEITAALKDQNGSGESLVLKHGWIASIIQAQSPVMLLTETRGAA